MLRINSCLKQCKLFSPQFPSVIRRDSPAVQVLLKRMKSKAGAKPKAAKKDTSPLGNGSNAAYVEDIYNAWLKDPTSVHVSWASFFRNNGYVSPLKAPTCSTSTDSSKDLDDNSAVQSIIRSYQARGHLVADLDPLGITSSKPIVNLDGVARRANETVFRQHSEFFFGKRDTSQEFKLPNTTFIGGDKTHLPLKDILNRLEDVYCKTTGLDFMFIPSLEQCNWIRKRFETPGARDLTLDEKKLLLNRLTRATGFEAFLAKKYPAEKRFGLEGCEMLIPALKTIIDEATLKGVDSIIIGMPHRGRLNTLANVCRKPLQHIFTQFFGLYSGDQGSGDVKYHLGTYIERVNRVTNKMVRLAIVANASHLESVNPIVLGKVRAEQFYRGDRTGRTVMPLLMHGDASFCGQGVVYEALHFANLPQYTCNGTIHIVVNNQVGFTTDPRFSRSSRYCTDVARVVNAPIFHVNADDPEAVIHASRVAVEWRATFGQDVVIDLVGYRRMGHNETDEPMFTQPLMYQKIKAHPQVLKIYSKKLIEAGVVKQEDVDKVHKDYEKICNEAFEEAKKETQIKYKDWIDSPWTGFFEGKNPYCMQPTGIKKETLCHIADKFSTIPPNATEFELHKGVVRMLDQRHELVKQNLADWALGEALAIGSLLKDGIHVRLSGQDVERGTFSHRHHVYHHQKVDKATFIPLQHLYPDQAHYSVTNSSLSEFAVLGFEHGYSMASPNQLIIWEAQFGDFANTAQCIIDQYISSGEAKWVRQSGLVMLLPHGHEGQGPEHSSARPERFLQMCADDADCIPKESADFPVRQLFDTNWIVACVSTPANLFHILRRQIALPFRKPLILMTPKSLLRHPKVRSSFCDMTEGSEFKRLIPDEGEASQNACNVEKLVFCTGKVYYDFLQEREDRQLEKEVALVRVEQICPFPFDLVKQELTQYNNAEIIWAQEEHKNQGYWTYVQPRFETALSLCKDPSRSVVYCGRPTAAATATGNKKQYIKEVEDMMTEVLGELSEEEKENIAKRKEEKLKLEQKAKSEKPDTKTKKTEAKTKDKLSTEASTNKAVISVVKDKKNKQPEDKGKNNNNDNNNNKTETK